MSLEDLRKGIDAIDEQIVHLLSQRAGIVERVRQEKANTERPIYDPGREAQLLRRICEIGADPLPLGSLRLIFKEIISACRALQSIRVAYLGPALTNTYLAALQQFGASAELRPCRSIQDVFDMVVRGETQVGIVPVENSLNGVVAESYDCLLETPLLINAESFLPIHHALLSKATLGEIKLVYSHPQVFAQTREWLRESLPGVGQIAMTSTAAAAKQAAEEEGAAAIAPGVAAEPYGLEVLAANIEDRPDNRTRFFVIGHDPAVRTGRDKTSIVFSTSHRAGSLHQALEPLHDHGINMTLIQSRPYRGTMWEYVFFVDFEGHVTDPTVAAALAALREQCSTLKVLGSYPTAD